MCVGGWGRGGGGWKEEAEGTDSTSQTVGILVKRPVRHNQKIYHEAFLEEAGRNNWQPNFFCVFTNT